MQKSESQVKKPGKTIPENPNDKTGPTLEARTEYVRNYLKLQRNIIPAHKHDGANVGIQLENNCGTDRVQNCANLVESALEKCCTISIQCYSLVKIGFDIAENEARQVSCMIRAREP